MAELVKAVLVMTQPTPDESHGHVYIKYSTSQRVGFVIHATGKEGDRVVLEWFNFAPGVNHPLLGIPGTGLVLGFYMMNISPSHIPGQLLQMAIQTMAVQPPDLGRSQGSEYIFVMMHNHWIALLVIYCTDYAYSLLWKPWMGSSLHQYDDWKSLLEQ